MNILIVYCHPSRKSYTYQVFSKLMEGLQTTGHNIIVSDLYAMNFQTDMSEAEYEREGFALTDKPLAQDVIAEQQKIQQSDCIIFIYPVWWSDCPAKLKGWFDRVYSVGFAYGYDKAGNRHSSMKKQKSGFVICTAGHPLEFLEQNGMAESMRKIMINDRLGPRFEEKQMIILGGTLDNVVKEDHLTRVFELGKNIGKPVLSE
jgi:NAD(P)H dehydrogenase (quinone)